MITGASGSPDAPGGAAAPAAAAAGAPPRAPPAAPRGRRGRAAPAAAPAVDAAVARRHALAFERGGGHGLLRLGAAEVGTPLPPVLGYWRDFGARYVTAVCTHASGDDAATQVAVPPPDDRSLAATAEAVPPMPGAERVTAEILRALWDETAAAFAAERAASGKSVQEFLKGLHAAWNLVGRVHFHLAENRRDEEAPFAFLATYTTRLSAHGRAQHVPLEQALREYAGAKNRERLLALLVPVQRAAEACPWLRAMVDAGEVFHPLRWSAADAVRFLSDVPRLESAGVVVRLPAAWKAGRPPRPRVTATLGGRPPAAGAVGMDALLDFQVDVTLDGEPLTADDVAALLSGTDGLAMIRGRWVEVDRERLSRTLDRFRAIERLAKREGIPFAEAARLLAGADLSGEGEPDDAARDWSRVVAGGWLAQALAGLRGPEGLAHVEAGPSFLGTLRPYQEVGVRWLHLLTRHGQRACLADDMGHRKTVQVLALLVALRVRGERRGPSLLVAPASLLANWAAEIERFAPSLAALVAHPSAMSAADLKGLSSSGRLSRADVVVTSYGSVRSLPALADTEWDLVVLDEAQAIKNPEARQTRAVKRLRARARIALTGTPIENRLGDLWSLFDFLDPGLLGTAKEFSAFAKRLAAREHDAYAPLRSLVRPYVLRRMKTDRAVIADLPEKTEVRAYCGLSRKQVALYRQAVADLARDLPEAEGMGRRGLVLASIMRLKQVCNHPSQWLGDGAWAEADSGKWERLREVAEVVASRQEKALVFSQFREVAEPLAAFLGSVFGRPGLVLHGGTPVAKRRDLVRKFQEDESVPFFVLSLKAGGSGLNLTAASHVIHLDRWWNPAVENQATDRAFRIGQKRNVLVHKFLCRGTIEEKIDELIESKVALSRDVLEGGPGVLLTEMKDDDLLRLVALDVRTAAREA